MFFNPAVRGVHRKCAMHKTWTTSEHYGSVMARKTRLQAECKSRGSEVFHFIQTPFVCQDVCKEITVRLYPDKNV